MMNKLLSLAVDFAIELFVRPRSQMARVHAAMRDLGTIRTVRKSLFALCVLITLVVLMAGGAVLIPVALCMFAPWEPQTRLWVALAFAAFYLLIPLVVAASLLSEKRWLRIFHVDELLREVVPKR